MPEINNNNSSISVEETILSTSLSDSSTSNTSPDNLGGSTTTTHTNSTNSCSSHNSDTSTIITATSTTDAAATTNTILVTDTSNANNCSCSTSQQNGLTKTTELGLHDAFELLDIDSEPWKTQDEKLDGLNSPAAGHFELGVCGAPPSTPSTSPPLTGGVVVTAAAGTMVSISGEEPLTGCISSLQKLKLLCQECRKANMCKCSKVHLKKKMSSSSMLDKFNLARSSSSSPRGVIKEARFRPHPSDSTEKSMLRASRLKFLSQLNAAKRAKYSANRLQSSNHANHDEANNFGQYSESSVSNFATLAQKTDNFHVMPPTDDYNSIAPQFLIYQNNSLTSGALPTPGHPRISASVGANPNIVPFSIDQTCSLQARLDDMSVNELACYFEEYVHIPKKMSEMAEMMYR